MSDSDKYDVQVSVEARYIEQESDPEQDRYVFAYTVTIINRGSVAARLMSRHWIITDSNGMTQEVRGDGVVGEQPYLEPGEGFRYTSGTVLDTPIGSMYGSYQMRADDGEAFEAPVKPFSLSDPRILH
ncbi:MAG: Co2+/Mg2+ efflux protein ApaG [Proteobacteria bacterium]|nr:MAG: Co2+/Mg2+ efflux protein ApaG [Pseudomonadota bacterium]